MAHDVWFDTDENRALLAICARKLIANIGVGGIIWGGINIVIGLVVLQESMIGIGALVLGVMMLGTGIRALQSPTLGVLLAETIVTVCLLLWNIGVSILEFKVDGAFDPRGIIFPLIIAITFANYYRKLSYIREQISSVPQEKIKATKAMCKTLVKKKLKDEPFIVETSDRKCRVQLMDDSAFFIQRDLMRAFIAPKEEVRTAIAKPDAKSLKLTFNHPVAELKYRFDKKNSKKLNMWLATRPAAAPPPAAPGTAA